MLRYKAVQGIRTRRETDGIILVFSPYVRSIHLIPEVFATVLLDDELLNDPLNKCICDYFLAVELVYDSEVSHRC